MVKGQEIICISTSDWERPWGSKQQLMSRLAADNKVLYVEYQMSFLHFCFLPILLQRIKKLKNPLKKVNGNLWVLTPYPYLPFGYYFRGINVLNQRIILWQLRKALKKVNFTTPVLWIYPPCAVDLAKKLNAKLNIYHCIADFPREKRIYLRNKTISAMENELIKRSDIVLVLTNTLYKKFREMNPNTHLFPSAVDESFFSSFLNADIEIPKDIINIKRPRIGLVSYLDHRIDVDLLLFLADKRPGWSIVLIGKKIDYLLKLNALLKRGNIYFLGEKKNCEIPAYIKNLDVCIIPYVVNAFTDNISSLKLYEYLAMGKPVVSTNLLNLSDFKGVIRISDTKEDFLREIELSLSEDNKELAPGRLNIARGNTWEKRLQLISGLMEKTNAVS